MKFRGDIEGLRAVAVIVVVLFHCGIAATGGGYIGVDVFFVLSGFLITTLMLDEITSKGRLSLGAFYGRRARRLLPASCLVVAVTVLVGWFVLSPLARRDLVGDALSASTYTVNWRFASQATDYFQSELAPSALQHYWSLAVEEQFYVVWPLFIWLLAGRRVRRLSLGAGIGIVVATSFVLNITLTAESQPWAFFGLHTRMWQLGAGAFLSVAWPLADRIPSTIRLTLPIAGLAAIVVAVVGFDELTPWPGTRALLPTLGAIAVLLGGNTGPVAAVLRQRPLVWLGSRSYSWYLWHWPALVLFAAWRDEPLNVPTALAVAIASLVIADIGYRAVEQPIRHRRALATSAFKSIAVGLGMSAACVVALLAIRPAAEHVDATGPDAGAVVLPDDTELAAFLDAAAAAADVPANLTPSLADARADLPSVYALGCHADIPDTTSETCELGDPAGAITAVLIGDSHAAQWAPALDQLGAERGIRIVPMTKSGCPVFDVPVFSSALNRVYSECDEWRQWAFGIIDELQPDVVIATQSSLFTPDGVPAGEVDATILDGYIASLNRFGEAAGSVVVLSDTPYPVGDVPDCLSGHLGDAAACTIDRAKALSYQHTDVEQAAADAAGAAYIAVDGLVCGSQRCPVVVGTLLVYRDNSHLSTPYVRWVAPALARRLGAPWADAASG